MLGAAPQAESSVLPVQVDGLYMSEERSTLPKGDSLLQ